MCVCACVCVFVCVRERCSESELVFPELTFLTSKSRGHRERPGMCLEHADIVLVTVARMDRVSERVINNERAGKMKIEIAI